MKVRAVVNWLGPTDVPDVLEGPNARAWAGDWIGPRPDRLLLAARLSPLMNVRPGLPPVITIHGDADPIVPYAHAQKLHRALLNAGVRSTLIKVRGGVHGRYPLHDQRRAWSLIRALRHRRGNALMTHFS